jgi:hypothetical protein
VRNVALRSSVVIAVGAIVLAGVLFVASTVDARAPQVLDIRITQPSGDDPQRALTTTSIEVVFNEPVVTAAGEAAFEIEPQLSGAFSWSGAVLTFTPDEPLPIETAFTVTVASGVTDLSGNRMPEPSAPFSFETAGRPTVVASAPEDGATGVPLDEPIELTFSNLMDTASVEIALTFDPAFGHDLRWAGDTLTIVPTSDLEPDQRYQIRLADHASDVAGVTLEREWEMSFRTVSSGLQPTAVVPADRTDGIALTTPIAVLFDRSIDPESVSDDMLTVTPEIAGTVDLIELVEGSGRQALRFLPSGSLPANTTFTVSLAPGLRSADGDMLAVATEWSFTTGSPSTTLSNQVIFLSDRSGVTNLWAMNADGTGRRQLTAELTPVLDYAAAPDGRRVVIGDGRRLVQQSANGADRHVLTEEGAIEFDPFYSDDGRTIVFGRANAATGSGEGIWSRNADGGDLERLPLAPELVESPGGSAADAPASALTGLSRMPRLAPDGERIAFIDGAGRIVIADLADESWVRATLRAAGPPVWLSDASGVLATSGGDIPAPIPVGEGVVPLDPSGVDDPGDVELVVIDAEDGSVTATPFGRGAMRPSIADDGSVAYLRVDDASRTGALAGALTVAPGIDQPGRTVAAAGDLRVEWVTAAPEPNALVLSVVDEPTAAIWLLDAGRGELTALAMDGGHARWLP